MFTQSPHLPTVRIAIYRTSSIGDAVLATSCLNMIKQLKVSPTIYWIGRQPSLNLISSAFPEIIPIELPRGEHVHKNEIASLVNNPHIIVDLQKNLRSRIICNQISKASGAAVFTWDKDGMRRTNMILRSRLFGRSKDVDEYVTRCDVFQYEKMLATMRRALKSHLPVENLEGIEDSYPPHLETRHHNGELPWQKELRFGNWLAVAPGASYQSKQAPLEVFEDILCNLKSLIRSDSQTALVFLGDESDRQVALEIIDRINWPNAVLNLAGKLSLWESALALKEARALVSNDSSLGHISEAVGTPTATLFGPTAESFGFAPRMPDSAAFSSKLGCRPCSKHGKTPCRYNDLKCFLTIDKEAVAAHLANLLGKMERDPVK